MATIRFVIMMPWGRVGSNLLMDILRQSGPMKLNSEMFNQLRTAEEQSAWFAEFYEVQRNETSAGHIGSKQNMLAVRDLARFEELVAQNCLRIVRLRRDNLVKAAVSQMRAERYAEKTRQETGTPRWAVKKGNAPLGPAHIDPDLLIKRIGIMQTQHHRLMSAFLHSTVLEIEYEEINSALDVVVRRLRNHLELPQKSFAVPFAKATPDDLRSAISNFSDIRARLAGTPHAAQLEA